MLEENTERLREVFGRFVGKEIKVENNPYTFKGKTFDNWKPVEDEPTLAAMMQVAAENGINLRIHEPGSMGSMDAQLGRANAYVTQDDDGVWRVADKFRYG